MLKNLPTMATAWLS